MKSSFVSLHPYFKAHAGKLDAAKAMLPRFVEKTATETENLFYSFSVSRDEIFAVKVTRALTDCSLIWITSARY